MNAPPVAERALDHLHTFLTARHPGYEDDPDLHNQARALSEAYTAGRLTPGAAASTAYLAHFGPRAIVATARAMRAVPCPEIVLEVGAGSGASALVLALSGARELFLCDADPRALERAEALLDGLAAVTTIPAPVGRLMPRYTPRLVLSAFSFGELPGTPAEALASLRGAAPKAEHVVIVDAGDRPHARRVQEARAVALEAGNAVLDPCPHQGACPALVRSTDWCMSRLDKRLPAPLARFAEGVGRSADDMAASLLVLGPGAPAEGALVLSRPHVEKGRVRVPVCGPGGLRYLQALSRHSAAYAYLTGLSAGDPIAALAPRPGTDTAHVTEGPA
jgi:hypothetical protein